MQAKTQEFSDYWNESLVPASFARQLDRDRARLVEALRYLLANPGDVAQVRRAEALLAELGE